MRNDIWQYLGLQFVNINAYANFIKMLRTVQEIGTVSLFPNFDLGKTSTNDKWHLAIPLARSCQNQCVCNLSISMCIQNFINISHTFQKIGPVSLFQNSDLGKASTDDKWYLAIPWAISCRYQCALVNINAYAKFHQNIPYG